MSLTTRHLEPTSCSKKIGALLASVLLFTFAFAGVAPAADVAVRWLAKDGSVLAEKTLDLAALDALPQKDFETDTPWTDGKVRFSGPSLADLAALAGRPVTGASIGAINDYSATVPAEDWTERGAILATRIDGRTLPVREKGPFWVMYPIDSDPALNSQEFFARMVWQVSEIDFVAE